MKENICSYSNNSNSKEEKLKCYLQGKSLYLVIFISFILAVFLMLLISNNYYTQVEILRFQNLKKIIDEDNSQVYKHLLGIEESENKDSSTILSLPADLKTKSFTEQWGGFKIIGVKSEWKHIHYEKTALTGNYLFDKEKTGLYLADQGKYLSIAGETRLAGNCFLPALGVRSVYIDGKAYKGGDLIHGVEKTSKKKLPELNTELTDWINKAFKGEFGFKDILLGSSVLNEKKLSRRFDQTAFTIDQQGILQINNINLNGKIVIRSDSMIILKNRCTTENIIVVAPKVIVESGFQGSLQLFVSDSLLIEDNVLLTYPSFVSVYNTNERKAFCYIQEDVEIQGGLLCGGKAKEGDDGGELFLSDNTVIHGIVYCNGSTRITGNVYGSLYTNRFVLKTKRGYYENHLLNAVVDPEKQYKDFLIPELFNSDKKEVIEWL